jgi:hypothetical protein
MLLAVWWCAYIPAWEAEAEQTYVSAMREDAQTDVASAPVVVGVREMMGGKVNCR